MTIAQTIANAIKVDFTQEQINEMTPEFKVDVTLAYMNAETRKIEQFQNLYITNQEFKDGFKETVFNQLKQVA